MRNHILIIKIFFILLFSLSAQEYPDNGWDDSYFYPDGENYLSNLDNEIYLSVFKNKLYVTGSSEWVNNEEQTILFVLGDNNWEIWHIPEFGSYLYTIYADANYLYAGGEGFRSFNGDSLFNLARYDGINWVFYGYQFDLPEAPVRDQAFIIDIATNSEGVYVVENWNLTLGGGSNVLFWNGDTFRFISSVSSGWINCIETYKDTVYIGGYFNYVDTIECLNIAKWDGEKWLSIGDGLPFSVYSIAVDSNGIYAGGIAHSPPWIEAYPDSTENISFWDGEKWNSVGGGTNHAVTSINFFGSKVVISGSFSTAGGDTIRGIGIWDGVSWKSVGSGLYPKWSKSNIICNEKLFVTGSPIVSGNDSTRLSCYNFTFTDIINSRFNRPNSFHLEQNYPNPFNPSTIISYRLPVVSDISINIYNSLGQKVRTLFTGRQQMGFHELSWDGRDGLGRAVSSGIYFYNLKTEEFSQTKKMLLLR